MKRWLVVFAMFAVCSTGSLALAQDEEVEAGEDLGESTDEPTDVNAEATSDLEGEDDSSDDDWWFDWFGYVRVAFESVQQDPKFDFIGNNNTGFVLHNARFGIAGMDPESGVSFQISFDGATDVRETVNTPQGPIDVRLRDAYVRWDPWEFIGLEVGQFKAPFSAEEMRSPSDLMFASRAVGLDGVLVGRGLEESGIVVGRQLGAMLAPAEPIWFDDFGVAYFLAATNGNGRNELLNDNVSLALTGRLELHYSDMVRVGYSILMNERTTGELPNLYEENDFGMSADLLFRVEGLELFGQYTMLATEFPTVGTLDQERVSLHGQIGYRFDQLGVPFGPAYRFAMYNPWDNASATSDPTYYESFKLTYHTMGLAVWHPELPLSAAFNYTLTGEEEARQLENDRLEILIQVIF